MLHRQRLLAFGLPWSLALLCGSALGQAFEPRLLDANGLLGGDAPRFVRRGGGAVGLGVPLAGGDGQAVVWSELGTVVLPTLPTHEVGDAWAMDAETRAAMMRERGFPDGLIHPDDLAAVAS